MPAFEITCSFSNEGSRKEVVSRLIQAFFKEKMGTGRGEEASRYTYYVETLNSGNRVYLKRPANLHNGFDFLVCVENVNYAKVGERRRNYPSHDDIGNDLTLKKREDPIMYSRFYELLKRVYECHDVDDSELNGIVFKTGLAPDHIIKVIKWLFIEQDIRYWNYSGRAMTWNVVPEP